MITIEQIKNDVENITGVDLLNKSRKRKYVEARALFYELGLRYTNNTIVSLADKTKRNHATLINARDNNFYCKFNDYHYHDERVMLMAKYNDIRTDIAIQGEEISEKIERLIKEIEWLKTYKNEMQVHS